MSSYKEIARRIELTCYKVRLQVRKNRQVNKLYDQDIYTRNEVLPIAAPICEFYGISVDHILTILQVCTPKYNTKNRPA